MLKIKKLLLTIFLITVIFQMVVLATAIDIGSAAITRSDTWGSYYTTILGDNPADGTGKITSIEIFASTGLEGCQVATFYLVSGTTFSTRDYETVDNGNGAGVVNGNSKQTFVVDLDVEIGDFIGMRYSSGYMKRATTGYTGFYKLAGDQIPCTDAEFSALDTGDTLSLYGTGATVEVGGTNVLFMFSNF